MAAFVPGAGSLQAQTLPHLHSSCGSKATPAVTFVEGPRVRFGLAGFVAAYLARAAVRRHAKKVKEGKRGKASSDESAAQDKMKQLEASLTKKYGEVWIPMDKLSASVPTFSTGALTLDMALGGGLPYGRLIEIYGPEQSGKTTIALSCIARVQSQEGGQCAFIDAEQALDRDYAQTIGVDMTKLKLLHPGTAEEALDICAECAKSGLFKLIVIDSVAALVPEEELDKDMGQMTIGLLARIMSKFCRKITPLAGQTNTAIFFTNQLRANIGGYGSPEITTGGNAIKYYTSVRMEIRAPKSGLLGPAESPYGIHSRVKVTKNKLAAPHRTGEFDIIFGEGISWESSVLEAGISSKVVEKGGAWLTYKDHKEQGKEKFTKYLEANPDVCADIEKKCRSRLDSETGEEEIGKAETDASTEIEEQVAA